MSLDDALRERVCRHLDGFERRDVPLDDRRAAGVAIAIVPGDDGEPAFLLTRRASKLRRHAGQWALPGGRVDPGETTIDAALRELDEEVGLAAASEAVLGRLDDYATVSGFVITPIVVWAGETSELRPDPSEVAALYRVPFSDLERPDLPHLRRVERSERAMISLPLCGANIHAPTAALIFQFREVAIHGRPTRVDHYEQPRFAWR